MNNLMMGIMDHYLFFANCVGAWLLVLVSGLGLSGWEERGNRWCGLNNVKLLTSGH